jgi:hypothetical protein
MAHHFVQAPDHFTVAAALRWGQVRGLGGSERLAHAVAATRLGQSFEHEDFWKTVLHFIINHPAISLDRIDAIVEYLHHQRFVPQEELVEEGDLGDLGPPQPGLSMKGRSPRSLLRQVADWHGWSQHPSRRPSLRWQRSAIVEFRHVEPDEGRGLRCWTIRELLSAAELRREGEAMRHCVDRYVGACARRKTTIWSLRFDDGVRRYRVLTIEVDPATWTIRQARRRGNAPPNEKVLGVLRQWAQRKGLRLGFWAAGVLVCY